MSGRKRRAHQGRTHQKGRGGGSGGRRGNRGGRRAAAGKGAPAGGGRSRPRRIVAGVFKWALTLGVWGVVALVLLTGYYALDLPRIDTATTATRAPSVVLKAAGGDSIAEYGDLYGERVSLDALPDYLPRALLATEDRRFYSHFGVDPIGLARALVANIEAGRIVQGGSTITQQLAKNLFLSPKQTLKRKVQELLLAFWLEAKYSKDKILQLYLNRIYMGAGTYGVEAAAQKYFGKSARKVTLRQAAILAGLPKAPSRYNPINSRKLARERAAVVLENMVAVGAITEKQKRRALAGRAVAVKDSDSGRYFADWVLEHVDSYVGRRARDLVVATTLDTGLQGVARRQLKGLLRRQGDKRDVGQGAVVVMEPDGAVRALVGGRSYARSPYNRATQARRQPGSAFKPFVYLAGLEAGLKPGSTVRDAPITIDGWSPQNFSGEYAGPVTLRNGLVHSRNTVAVRVGRRAGWETVADTARRLGIDTHLDVHPSLALGTSEVTLLDLTTAYAAFASGGRGAWAHGITRIQTPGGKVLYDRSGSGPGRVIEKGRARRMNRMLHAVVQRGTGHNAALPGRAAAGKTGTSQESRDAWFVGFTGHYVAGVWLGNDDGHPTDGVVGGGLPAKLWKRIMTAAHKGLPPRPIPGVRATQQADAAAPADEGDGGDGLVERLIRSLGE